MDIRNLDIRKPRILIRISISRFWGGYPEFYLDLSQAYSSTICATSPPLPERQTNMSFTSHLQATNLMVVGAKSPVDRRRKALKRVNKELSRGKYETALSLVKQLKGKHGCLSAFASAKLVSLLSYLLSFILASSLVLLITLFFDFFLASEEITSTGYIGWVDRFSLQKL